MLLNDEEKQIIRSIGAYQSRINQPCPISQGLLQWAGERISCQNTLRELKDQFITMAIQSLTETNE